MGLSPQLPHPKPLVINISLSNALCVQDSMLSAEVVMEHSQCNRRLGQYPTAPLWDSTLSITYSTLSCSGALVFHTQGQTLLPVASSIQTSELRERTLPLHRESARSR